MVRDKPIGKTAEKLLAKLRAGQTLCCEVVRTEAAASHEAKRYFLEPGGDSAGPVSAKRLIESGLVVPNVDGLFGASDAQSYRAVIA